MTYKNIFYFKRIAKIGGTEQFLYEIAKKYKDYDITFFYDSADSKQLKRIKQYCRCKKRIDGEIVECEKAFFNFNADMIKDVKAKEYIFVSHANYDVLHEAHGGYIPPIDNELFTGYIGVSQFAADKLDEYRKRIGKNIKPIKCYNPISLESKEKVIHFISACRLDDKVKGGERTIKFIEAADRYCAKTGRHYLFHIFSNPINFEIKSPNVCIMKPRIDVRPFIADSDYVCIFSDDMETYSYTSNEALGYGVPIITTPLSILKELDVNSNNNIILNWDCSNVDEVVKEAFERQTKPFEYKIPEDDWNKFLAKGKSTYSQKENKHVKVECLRKYYDIEEDRQVFAGEVLEVSEDRAKYLSEERKLVKIK